MRITRGVHHGRWCLRRCTRGWGGSARAHTLTAPDQGSHGRAAANSCQTQADFRPPCPRHRTGGGGGGGPERHLRSAPEGAGPCTWAVHEMPFYACDPPERAADCSPPHPPTQRLGAVPSIYGAGTHRRQRRRQHHRAAVGVAAPQATAPGVRAKGRRPRVCGRCPVALWGGTYVASPGRGKARSAGSAPANASPQRREKPHASWRTRAPVQAIPQ